MTLQQMELDLDDIGTDRVYTFTGKLTKKISNYCTRKTNIQMVSEDREVLDSMITNLGEQFEEIFGTIDLVYESGRIYQYKTVHYLRGEAR